MKKLVSWVVMGAFLAAGLSCAPKKKPTTSPVTTEPGIMPSGKLAKKPPPPPVPGSTGETTITEITPEESNPISDTSSVNKVSSGSLPPQKTQSPAPSTTGKTTTTQFTETKEIKPKPQSPPPPPPQSAPTPSVPQPAAGQPAVQTFVYQVQLFAFKSFKKATDVMRQLRKQYPSYKFVVEKEDGLAKVRVGDFPTRMDAEKAKEFFKSRGYKDAFIVGVMTSTP